jgi:hypothetical protein
MALRRWIKRLERAARGGDHSFELKDGTRYYYDYAEVGLELYIYACDAAPDAEEPLFIQKVRQAKDPAKALEPFQPRREEDAWLDFSSLILEILEEDGPRDAA